MEKTVAYSTDYADASHCDEGWRLIHGDAKDVLSQMDDDSVDCCVTSPPYYALRDYGYEGQIGLEQTPEAYIDRLVSVFREVRRILKPSGTLWVNIGDSYWGSGSRGFDFTSSFTEKSKIQQDSKGTMNLSNVPPLKGKWGGVQEQRPYRHSVDARLCSAAGRMVFAAGHYLGEDKLYA